MTPEELCDKYRGRQRGTDLEAICELMDKNGVTLSELQQYIENRPKSTMDRVVAHRKKLDVKRRFANGRNLAGKSSKSTQAK